MSGEEAFARRKGLDIRDALVFLVDFRTPMLRRDARIDIAADLCTPGASSLLSITLRCIADVLKAKIIARSSDVVAVVAFGVRGLHTRQKWPGVRVLRPLRPPDAAAVKQLQRLAQRVEAGEAERLLAMEDEEVEGVEVKTGDEDFCFGAGMVQFDKVLWAVRHQFTTAAALRASLLHRKRVFLFTNDSDPTRGSRAVKQLCLTQAADLADLGATLDVSLLTSPGMVAETGEEDEVLESEGFFNDLVYTEEEGGVSRGSVMIATVYSFDDLLTRVRRKEMTKRALRKTVLVLGDEYKIGVALYALLRKATRPAQVKLAAKSNKPVFRITTTTCQLVGEILKPQDVRYMFVPDYLKNSRYKVPGLAKSEADGVARNPEATEQIVYGFKKNELVKAKALGKVGIYMYGFRKKSALRRELALGAPTFVYPDEDKYVGSTKAFSCLLKSMLKKDVIGIASVRLSDKSGGGMRFAALVPQQEDFSETLEHTVPGGLQLHYLPYEDDIYTAWRKEMETESSVEEKDLPVKQDHIDSKTLPIESESVSVARRMVRKLTISRYSPHLFLNPDLQRFYAGLENAAGVESRYNPQDDLLNPDIETMQARAGHLATELKRLDVGPDFDGKALAEQFGTKSKKRGVEKCEAAVQKKAARRSAAEEAAQACDDDMYLTRYRAGTLGQLHKPALQTYCMAHGINEKGLKKDLVIRVEDHIEVELKSTSEPP